MPKSKMKKELEQKRSDDKREKYYQSIKNTLYKNGTIPMIYLKKLPITRKKEYIKKEITKKYNKDISYTCEICATTLLYNDNGRISDEELVIATGARLL